MIVIGPGDGLHLRLYDYEKTYAGVQEVDAINAEVLVHYADEDSSAARSLGIVELGQDVVIPFATEVDRPIVVRAVTRAIDTGSESRPDRRLASQTSSVASTRRIKPYIALAGPITHGCARISVQDWSRFARVRKIEIADDSGFTTNLRRFAQDIDAGVAGLTDHNELPDWIDLVRGDVETGDLIGIAPATNKYFVRVAHSYESTDRATGATYTDKVDSLLFSEYSDTLEIDYSASATTNQGGDTGAAIIGIDDGIFLYTHISGDLVVPRSRQLFPATRWIPGIVATSPTIQYLSGRKSWSDQQVFGVRGLGLGTTDPLPGTYSWPDARALVYSEIGDAFKTGAIALYRAAADAEPTRLHGYKARSVSGGTPPNSGDALLRIAPAISGLAPTTLTQYFSSRIDFILTGTPSSSDVPVAVDIYGGAAPSTSIDATGVRGLRVDNTGNAVAGVASLGTSATGGFLWAPESSGTPAGGTPSPNYTGYIPLILTGGATPALHARGSSGWVNISGAGGGALPAGSGTEVQYRASSTTFGAITSSSVSGANMTLGGILTVQSGLNKQVLSDPTLTNTTIRVVEFGSNASPSLLRFERARGTSVSPSNVSSGDVLGKIEFQGRVSGVLTTLGYLQCSWDTTEGGILGISTGQTTPRTFVALGTATDTVTIQGFNGSTFNILTVTPAGISLTGGSTNGAYYKNTSGYITTTSSPPAADRMLFWDDSAGAYAWLEAGSGLTITGTVMTSSGGGGGSPGGSATELQYRSGASTFGAVSNSAVSGANVTLGGTLSLDAAGSLDQSIVLSALSASDTKITFTEYRGSATPILLQFDRSRGSSSVPANLSSDDIIGELKFRGRVTGALAQLGYLRGAWSSTDGGAVQLGAGATSGSGTRFVATVNSGAGIFDAGGNFFTVSGSGFQFSHGSTGATYYRSALGLFTDLPIGLTSQYLKGGTIPLWGGLDASHVTAGTLALARGGTGSSLTDPGGDRILFWDDSAGVVTWLEAGSGLTISGTTMTASASSSTNILAGSVTLSDNTLTNIFTITFPSTSDHKGISGEVHMVFVAKQTTPFVNTQVYRRKVHFVAGHNGSANTGACCFHPDTSFGTVQVAASGGFSLIQHAVNSSGAINFDSGTTEILLGTQAETLTYKILANSDLTNFSQFTCYYYIIYIGDTGVTIA